jgi:hypothetical protein
MVEKYGREAERQLSGSVEEFGKTLSRVHLAKEFMRERTRILREQVR